VILAVIPSPVAGGAEAQTVQVARGLGALVTADGALGLATPGLAAALAFDAARPVAENHTRQGAAMRAVLARCRPEAALVCCALPNEGLGAMLALGQAGVPQLGVAHLVRADWNLGESERAALAVLRAGWAAVSEPAARRLEALFGLGWGAVAALPNGLPPATPRLREPARPPVLLQVGRLDHRKGADLAPFIAARIAPGVLALAGEGPLAGQLPGVRELGRVDDIRAELARATAFLLPSLHEGCPLSVLEAAQEGCPVIATAAALEAWPEAARMAWVVPREAGAIAAAFAAIQARPEEARERAAVARAVAAEWDEAAMLRRTEALLAMEVLRWRG
jgi:glycosyltransferase involved in cell wall biosynthesis